MIRICDRLAILLKKLNLGKPFCSSAAFQNVRVRFAPSPTGYIHVGGLRTALYNHLFAKSKNGVTILRIEDTDRTRVIEGAAEQIAEDLRWCGITFDEGPYFQSERLPLYKKHAELLIDYGEAYYCFCSQERLDLMRRDAKKSGEIVKYDNKCRHLTKVEVEQRLRNEETYCIRFKMSDAITEFNDLIHGLTHLETSKIEGDPIILKSDGFPTYHLANVVDDHDMRISHVLRGSEWLISTVKHLLMYKAFRWKPPEFGHLPLLLNSDGTKFSKRQNSLRISHFKEAGIFSNALINLLTSAGGGFDISHSERSQKNFSMEELVNMFDLSKVHKSSCKLPLERLDQTNYLEMKKMLENKRDTKVLLEKTKVCIMNHFSKSDGKIELLIDDDYILRTLHFLLDRINKVEDLLSKEFIFLWARQNKKFEELGNLNKKTFKNLIFELGQLNWEKNVLSLFFKNYAKSHNVAYKDIMSTIRILLTGQKDGPGVVDILALLGKEDSLFRLEMSISDSLLAVFASLTTLCHDIKRRRSERVRDISFAGTIRQVFKTMPL